MKKRPLTLTAGILGTVFFALYVLGSILILAVVGDIFNSLSEISFTVLAVLFVPIAFGIVALILNACSISAFSASPENYKHKKGVIITAIVFNLLEVAFTIYGLVSPAEATSASESSTLSLVIDILVMAAIVLASVFYIVDLCLENKRVAKIEHPKKPPIENA